MLELSSKGFMIAIMAMFHEANYLTISRKQGIPSRETETIKKNPMDRIKNYKQVQEYIFLSWKILPCADGAKLGGGRIKDVGSEINLSARSLSKWEGPESGAGRKAGLGQTCT